MDAHFPASMLWCFAPLQQLRILVTIPLYFVPHTLVFFGKTSVKSTPTVAFFPQNLLIQRKKRKFAAEFVLHRSKKTTV